MPNPMLAVSHRLTAIVSAVSAEYGIASERLRSDRDRHRCISEARVAVYWLARVCSRASYPEIGRHMGRDHSTIINGVKRGDHFRRTDRAFREMTDRLSNSLGLAEREA